MSKVYFVSSRVLKYRGLLRKFEELLDYLKLDFIHKHENVLIKTHFGEDGNTTFISPMYIRKVSDFVKSKEAHPFVGDTSTLYSGRRKEGVTHLELAYEHGFTYSTVNAPVVIIDGLRSNYVYNVETQTKHFTSVQLAGEFVEADSILVMSHVKGHMIAGMGAAIKNLSMGIGSRTQKQRMHGDVKPQWSQEECILCDVCVKTCPEEAISKNDNKIIIDLKKCVGCAECITKCPTQALEILWNETPKNLAEKMAETALATMRIKSDKMFFFNFLINITPDCDCMGWSDNPVINDIGILAGTDPIALDKASYDLINKQEKLNNSILEKRDGEVFAELHRGIDPIHQLKYGEKIGIGSLDYELIDLEW